VRTKGWKWASHTTKSLSVEKIWWLFFLPLLFQNKAQKFVPRDQPFQLFNYLGSILYIKHSLVH